MKPRSLFNILSFYPIRSINIVSMSMPMSMPKPNSKAIISIFIATVISLIYCLYKKKSEPTTKATATTTEASTNQTIKKKKKTRPLPLGVINLGNSCYLSSVLQLLAASGEILIEYFENKSDSPIGKELSKVLKRINSGEGEALRPIEFIRSFSGSARFSTDQQDAHEFLLALLNLPSIPVNSQSANKNVKTLSLAFPFKISQQFYEVKNPFTGLILSELICLPCAAGKHKIRHISSINLEPFSCITLTPSVTDPNEINEIVYKHFCVPERFSDYTNFNFLGGTCGKGAVKQKNPLVFPELLFLHISLLSGSLLKTSGSIKSEVELSGPGYRYKLLGVIVHFGSNDGNSGHFVCYRKNQDDTWCECNDATVRKVSEAEVLSHQAYILIYSKEN